MQQSFGHLCSAAAVSMCVHAHVYVLCPPFKPLHLQGLGGKRWEGLVRKGAEGGGFKNKSCWKLRKDGRRMEENGAPSGIGDGVRERERKGGRLP